MKASINAVASIQYFEDCKVVAYADPKTGGDPWTIGHGHTGPEVCKGLVWTRQKADDVFFNIDLARFEKDVNSLVKIPITQGQFDALVSFAYNCGSDIDSDTIAEGLGDSTLLKYVNAGKFELAANEFPKWISKGTPAENGLRKRRAIEREIFLGKNFNDALRILKFSEGK